MSCLISLFYIKPQQCGSLFTVAMVVLYRYSTSNHNSLTDDDIAKAVVLYRYSTSNHNCFSSSEIFVMLSYIVILHQTTTLLAPQRRSRRCLISLFYIKPQRIRDFYRSCGVVLYRYSTSNHNHIYYTRKSHDVVLYRYSTSNHNCIT